MMTPASNSRRPRRSATGRLAWRLTGLLLLLALGWFAYVYREINQVASEDQAQPADAIAVFGAAEYGGRPSPVFHARLDHAVTLYRRQVAPLVITLGGGSDRDSGLTEGGVGRDYLLASGVPYADILAETRSVDTEQQVQRLTAIAREHDLHHIVVVSDGTHLLRIRELCEEAGLEVWTSPRPTLGRISDYDLSLRYLHELLSYTSLRLGLPGSWMHRWLEGRGDE